MNMQIYQKIYLVPAYFFFSWNILYVILNVLDARGEKDEGLERLSENVSGRN